MQYHALAILIKKFVGCHSPFTKCSRMISSNPGFLPVRPVDLKIRPLDQQYQQRQEPVRKANSQPHPRPIESKLCGYSSNCVLRKLPGDSDMCQHPALANLKVWLPLGPTPASSETLPDLRDSPKPHSAKGAQPPAKGSQPATQLCGALFFASGPIPQI